MAAPPWNLASTKECVDQLYLMLCVPGDDIVVVAANKSVAMCVHHRMATHMHKTYVHQRKMMTTKEGEKPSLYTCE